ncbi:MAG: hypothetical protein V4583_05025 [Pseudomonadota bacterium]
MDKRYKDIQDHYRDELHAIMPAVMDWWFDGVEASTREAEGMTAFERRWPAGPAAHPRVIDVFRRYFIETDTLNLENERPSQGRADPYDEQNWGTIPVPETRAFVRPIDLLVHDLESVDPDLFEILAALVFVPVGIDPAGEFV